MIENSDYRLAISFVNDISKELWNSNINPGDYVPSFAKFCSPTIANGHVYLATFSGQVLVYGLLK